MASTPLKDFSTPVQIVVLLVGLLILSVLLNVANQLLLPKNKSLPPVVFHYLPIIGSAVTYGIDPYAFFENNRKKHGDVFTFVLLGRSVTVALGSKGSNLILNGKLSQVSAEEAYTHLTTPVFGKEVVYDVPNSVLMEQKKFVKVGLSTENMKVYVDQITDELTSFISSDSKFSAFKDAKSGTSQSVDIFKSMCEITILTASRTLQGREVRKGLDKSFADLYHDLDSGFTPINFVIPNLPLPNNFKRDRAQKKMSDFYREIVRKRREEGILDNEHDMISALMTQSYKNGRAISDVEIAHMMIALLMAGQHTSSATGSWAMLRLASKPWIISELYQEQLSVYGNPDGSLKPLNYADQKNKTPILDSVIRETLRLHPPIHSIMRKVLDDIPVPTSISTNQSAHDKDGTPYVIPKGHFVMAAPGVSQIDPKIWKDSMDFNPKRWLGKGEVEEEKNDETVDYGWGAVSSGANSPYLPFGAGRHRCIGEQFAYLQLGVIISNFVRRFDWKLDGEFPKPDYSSMVVLPKAPTNIILTQR